jgi:hypothetical protein
VRLFRDELVGKALLALEDAVQECRYRQPRRSFAIRFALAYLWTQAQSPARRPFVELWQALGAAKSPWSYSCADHALAFVYKAVGVERDNQVGMRLCRRWARSEGNGGRHD